MARPVDPITEADLQAFVEDQLPAMRRIEVEAHLCEHAADAMRVMADLRIRDELRLALSAVPASDNSDTMAAARRLERGLTRGRLLRQFRRVAMTVALIGVGWFAHTLVGAPALVEVAASTPPPTYVAEAIRAHRTSQLRAVMHSQPESPDYDAAEIRLATQLVVPALPEDWAITDVQIYPSSFGPSLEIALRTEAFGELSLFAVQPGSTTDIPVTNTWRDDLAAAYWQHGSIAYVLVTRTASADLDAAASRLSSAIH